MKQDMGCFPNKVCQGQATHLQLGFSAGSTENTCESSFVQIIECKKKKAKQK